jgi:hypothetical protein
MTDEFAYTGAQATFSYNGGVIAAGEVDIKKTRAVASSGPRLGKYGQFKVGGGFDFTGSVKRIQIDGELLVALMTDTPTTGTAETLKSGRAITADGWVDNTDTSIATPSRIRLTVATAPVTTAGTITVVGEDANGNGITEEVSVGLLGIGEYATTKKVFKQAYGTYNHGVVSATGTLTVASITGDSTAGVGAPLYWDMIARVDSGTKNIVITALNCFFTSGGFKHTSPDAQGKDEMTFTMQDVDADLTVSYVSA